MSGAARARRSSGTTSSAAPTRPTCRSGRSLPRHARAGPRARLRHRPRRARPRRRGARGRPASTTTRAWSRRFASARPARDLEVDGARCRRPRARIPADRVRADRRADAAASAPRRPRRARRGAGRGRRVASRQAGLSRLVDRRGRPGGARRGRAAAPRRGASSTAGSTRACRSTSRRDGKEWSSPAAPDRVPGGRAERGDRRDPARGGRRRRGRGRGRRRRPRARRAARVPRPTSCTSARPSSSWSDSDGATGCGCWRSTPSR